MEAICRIFLKNLVFWSVNQVFPSKTLVFWLKNLVFQCITQISIEKVSLSNWKTKFFNPYTEKPSFLIEKHSSWSSDRKSHIFIANANLTADRETTCPVSIHHTSFKLA